MNNFDNLVEMFTLDNPHFPEIYNHFNYGEYSAEQRIWEYEHGNQVSDAIADTGDYSLYYKL